MPDLKDPTAKGTLMEPVFFVNGQKLALGTKDADRRAQLATWVTAPDNPWFARAFVNRLWSELVGEGFYEPVDDLGPDRECSAPATLALLADSFVASGYDIKWLFRAITSTAAYQRASGPRRLPDSPPFVANASQRLRADQLYNQLVALLGINDGQPERAVAPNAPAIRRGPRMQFNQMFGYDPSAPRDEISGSIPQALILMNAPNLAQAFDARRGPLGRLANSISNNEQLVVELYLRTLCREPSSAELATCQAHFESASSRAEATEDLAWALVNSTEFLYRP